MTGHNFKATDLINDSKILKKKKKILSLLALKNTASQFLEEMTDHLSACQSSSKKMSMKCSARGSEFGVNLTADIYSFQTGWRILTFGPYFDALPEQAQPTDWGTGTRTTLIDLFLWRPSY